MPRAPEPDMCPGGLATTDACARLGADVGRYSPQAPLQRRSDGEKTPRNLNAAMRQIEDRAVGRTLDDQHRPAGVPDGTATPGDDHLQTRDDVIGDLAARAQAHVAGPDRQVPQVRHVGEPSRGPTAASSGRSVVYPPGAAEVVIARGQIGGYHEEQFTLRRFGRLSGVVRRHGAWAIYRLTPRPSVLRETGEAAGSPRRGPETQDRPPPKGVGRKC